MSMTVTLWLLAATVLIGTFAGWRGARPVDLVRGPRMAPWRFIMLLSAAVAMLLFIHVGTLVGFARPG